MAGPTVVIADAQATFRAGVRRALERNGFTIAAEARDARGAVAAVSGHQPDLCLLDVDMPGSGIRAAATIAQRLPGTAIVMLTASRSDEDLFASLRAGAAGYLLKDVKPDRLPLLLAGVLDGEAAIPPTLVTRLVEEFRGWNGKRLGLDGRRPADLTSREWQVVGLLQMGKTTAEMAGVLGISAVTVRRHVSEIVRKLGVPDREAAQELLARQAGSGPKPPEPAAS